jgi:exo-beta-1,3-glucanase (GH17 family)
MTLRLERLRAFNATGWQRHCESLEAANTDLQSQITAIAAAQAAATAAATAATAAQATATASTRESARIASYPNPGSVLSAADVGTDCTITIANHIRVYPVQGSIDVPDVSITGGTITGKAFSTRFYIYYDDTTLAVTAPTFVATTASATAQVGAAAGRHYIGFIDTPADGAGGTSGQGGGPPGGGGGGGGGMIP